ncbi:MAG: hypothetical protein V4561_05770 [Bacteroidota bacterium]
MSKLYKFCIIFFSGIALIVQLSFAQSGNSESSIADSSSIATPSTDIQSREITLQDWNVLTRDSAFSYKNMIESEAKPHSPSKFELWLAKAGGQLFQFFFSVTGQIVFWALVLIILGYVLFRIFKGDVNFLFNRNERSVNTISEIEISTEDLTTADWDAKIVDALKDGNTRLAVRYLFVKGLQLLHQQQLILYSLDKTNYDYYRMLEREDLKVLYRQLMVAFEYAWFGKMEVDEQQWASVQNVFEQLKARL